MISKSIVVQQLVLLLKAKGVSEIFVSPGSRNAPLSISLNRDSFFNCKVIPDERVSGFMALGAAQATGNHVALVCTSGSALLHPKNWCQFCLKVVVYHIIRKVAVAVSHKAV